MKLPRVRSTCNAPNCFSPAAVLHQNFVAPYYTTRQQRFSSSAPTPTPAEDESARDAPNNPELPAASPSARHRSDSEIRIRYWRGNTVDRGDDKWRKMKQEGAPAPKSVEDWGKVLGPAPEARHSDGKGDRRPFVKVSEIYVEQLLLRAQLAFDDREDYAPMLIRPIPGLRVVPEEKLPWSARNLEEKLDPMARLNREIYDFWEYARPSKTEDFARKNLVEQVRADVRARLPNHILEVFGSERTGLALALSDIDLRLVKRDDLDQLESDKPPTPEERRDVIRNLYDIRYQIFSGPLKSSAGKYLDPKVLHARYPLVSVRDRGSSLDVQIVASNNTTKQREWIRHYIKEYPYILQTYTVIKTLLSQRGLSDVFRGGFGSYPLFMMIVISLQQQPNQRRDAAGALVNFLYYWAYFDTRKHAVSVSPSELLDKKENPILTDTERAKQAEGLSQPLPDYALSIRDPADETNDLGRKSSSILHLQGSLRWLVAELIRDLNKNDRPSLLGNIVGSVYVRDDKRRRILAAHGSWIQKQMHNSVYTGTRTLHIRSEQQDMDRVEREMEDVEEVVEKMDEVAQPAPLPVPKEVGGDIYGFLEEDTEPTAPTDGAAREVNQAAENK